jgi:WD40 repeat protein
MLQLQSTYAGHARANGADYPAHLALCGDMVASVSRFDSTVHLWSAATGERRALCSRPGAGMVKVLALSPSGEVLAAGSEDGLVDLWGTANGNHLTTYRGHLSRHPGAWPYALAFSRDGWEIASAATDASLLALSLVVWDPFSGQEMGPYTGHAEAISALAWGPGELIASTDGSAIQLWGIDVGAWRVVGRMSLRFSPDGTRLLVNGLEVWDVGTRALVASHVAAVDVPCVQAAWLDGERVLCRRGERVWVWDARSPERLVAQGELPAEPSPLACALSACYVATSHPDGLVRVWRLETGVV